MKTLDYIHLDAVAAGKVVEALQQLLADYQVFYTNLRGFIGTSRDTVSLSFTASSKTCITMPPERWMSWLSVS